MTDLEFLEISNLTERQKFILRARSKGQTFKEISGQVKNKKGGWGISPGRAWQLSKKSLRQLAIQATNKNLEFTGLLEDLSILTKRFEAIGWKSRELQKKKARPGLWRT